VIPVLNKDILYMYETAYIYENILKNVEHIVGSIKRRGEGWVRTL